MLIMRGINKNSFSVRGGKAQNDYREAFAYG